MAEPSTNRKAIFFILVTVLLDVLGLGIVIPVLPHLVADMVQEDPSSAARWFGAITASYALMQFLFAPVAGALSDRFGRRPVLLVSMAAMACNYVVIALAPSLVWLFVARMLVGITGASFTVAGAYVADVSPPEKRAQSFGLVGAMFGLGFIFGPALGGMLGHIGTRVPFWASAAIVAVNFLYGWFVLPESLPVHLRRSFDIRRANPLGGLARLARFPLAASLAVVFALATLAHRSLESVWVLYTAYRYGWRELENGMALAVVGVSSFLVQAGLIRKVVPRIGERRAVVAGLCFSLTGMFFYGLSSSGWMMLATMPVAALGALAMPSLQGLVSRNTPPDEQGSLQGIFASIMSLSSVLAPLVASQLLAGFTGPDALAEIPGAPFFAAALYLVAALLLALRAFRAETRAARPERLPA
jgi:DHA1 family tetracycline resistance protein-like MFS transporter